MPLHASAIGTLLPHDYFSPGTVVMHGIEIGSPWVVAYWKDKKYHYERSAIGSPWQCVDVQYK